MTEGNQFGHAFDDRFSAGGPNALGFCPRHGFDVAIGRNSTESIPSSFALLAGRTAQPMSRKCALMSDFAGWHGENDDYVKLLNLPGTNFPLHFRYRSTATMLARHDPRSTTMANLTERLDAATGQQISALLQRLRTSRAVGADLLPVLDIAIGITGADMGTLQRFDEGTDCLTIVASRGFSSEALMFFGTVRRDTNTTCAAALTRRMRVFVEDVSTSYLFVGTRELDMLRASGVAAALSTPLISSSGRLRGVLTTHFHKPQMESEFDPAPLDRLAVEVADSLEQRETSPQELEKRKSMELGG